MKKTTKQEVINLLAWYNLGKLSDDEHTMVEKALKEDPTLKEHLLIEQSMATLVKEDKTLLDQSLFENSQSRLDNVLAKIDILEGTQTVAKTETIKQATPVATEEKQSIFAQLKTKFDDLLTSSSHSFTYAVFAALTVVQLGLLVFFIVPSVNMDTEGEYYTASADTQMIDKVDNSVRKASKAGGIVLLIGMENHIKLEGIRSLPSDVKIDLLPSTSGYYRVRVNKKLSEIELQELKNELSKKHGAIQFIGEESNF
jgi:hypothetical protein